MDIRIASLVLVFIAVLAEPVSAACTCICTPQGVRGICEKANEVLPVCAPQVCPAAPSTVALSLAPTVPPVGTPGCYPHKVFNPNTQEYQWQRVCGPLPAISDRH